jgi:hypothetical protein
MVDSLTAGEQSSYFGVISKREDSLLLPQKVASPISCDQDVEHVANDADAIVTEIYRSIQQCISIERR